MDETGEDLALGPEALHDLAGVESEPHPLEGDLLFVLVVVPLGEVDVPHAPPADGAQDAIEADARAEEGIGERFGLGIVVVHQVPLDGEGLLFVVTRQQSLDLAAQLAVAAADLVEERSPLAGRLLEDRDRIAPTESRKR